jgi:hypothetical protein
VQNGHHGERNAPPLLTAILTAEIKRLAELFPKEYLRARRLRWRHACERVALHMPAEAKRLFGKRVTWRAVARYTKDLEYYDVDEQQKEIAARSGLLR